MNQPKGLVEKTESGVVYLQIKHFTLCEESKTERPGFVPVKVKNPRTEEEFTKYIKPYKKVDAFVDKIEWRDVTYQDQQYLSWKLYLDAAGTPCTLEIPFSSIISTRLMKTAENIDFSQPVEFSAWKSQDDKTAFSIRQNGNIVSQKYTRDNPGECPEPIKSRLGKWNYDAQTEFLYDRMMNFVIPAVDAAAALRKESAPKTESEGEPEYPYEGSPDDNDAPF